MINDKSMIIIIAIIVLISIHSLRMWGYAP